MSIAKSSSIVLFALAMIVRLAFAQESSKDLLELKMSKGQHVGAHFEFLVTIKNVSNLVIDNAQVACKLTDSNGVVVARDIMSLGKLSPGQTLENVSRSIYPDQDKLNNIIGKAKFSIGCVSTS